MRIIRSVWSKHGPVAGILVLALVASLVGAAVWWVSHDMAGLTCVQGGRPPAGITSVSCGWTRYSDRTSTTERVVEDGGAGPAAVRVEFSQHAGVTSNRQPVTSVDGHVRVIIYWQKDWGELRDVHLIR